MNKGKIICLNGVSSSGKSTLARALQETLKQPYYWMSEDTFTFILPDKFNIFKNDTIDNGEIWDQAIINYYHAIKMYSDRGCNVIVDGVFDDEEWVDMLVEILHNNPVLFVHVTCPEEELIKRELSRGDREIGLAIEQLALLSPKEQVYDITVDTHANTIEECTGIIIVLLDNPDNYKAFGLLREKKLCLRNLQNT